MDCVATVIVRRFIVVVVVVVSPWHWPSASSHCCLHCTVVTVALGTVVAMGGRVPSLSSVSSAVVAVVVGWIMSLSSSSTLLMVAWSHLRW